MQNRKAVILVVDDEKRNIDALVACLGSEYNVRSTLDASEGIRFAQSENPDLLLLDIVMPGMNGLDLCAALKNDSRTEHIPIIFITSTADETVELLGLHLGAIDFITKPFSPGIVRARVRNHLKWKRLVDRVSTLAKVAEARSNEMGTLQEFVQSIEAELRRP